MKQISDKLKLIYVPFLLIALGVAGGYTFLHWLLQIRMHLFPLREDVVNLWIPLALPWIPVLVWLRPRIRLLELKDKRGNLPSLYVIIASIAIAIPTLILQAYLETACGKLTSLDNIHQVGRVEPTRYYTLKDFYLDRASIGVKSNFETIGRQNETLDMSLFVVIPVLSSQGDKQNPGCDAWYGIKYNKQISNRLDVKEKEKKFREFAAECQAEFEKTDFTRFIYLENIPNSEDHARYLEAVKENKKYAASSSIILLPVNEPFEVRNGNKLAWFLGVLAAGAFIWLLMLLFPSFNEAALEKFRNGTPDHGEKITESICFLVPREGFFITPLIMYINILLFAAMVFSGMGFLSFSAPDLLKWGANCRPFTLDGEWWRLLTNTFLHGGFMHLFANMYGLLFVGIFLEPVLGKWKYAAGYLVTGLVASAASLWWHENTLSVGASGAIFGLYGIFLALLLTKVFPRDFSKAFLVGTLIFIGYNLLSGLTGGIDNAAHTGGLASGFIIGMILSPGLKQHAKEYGPLMERVMEEAAGMDSQPTAENQNRQRQDAPSGFNN